MPRTVSEPESRWWLAAAAIYGAILATLGVAPDVADELRRRGALDLVFGAGALLVLVAVVARTVRPGRREVVIVTGLVAVAVLVAVRLTTDVERTHLVEYAVLAMVIDAALEARRTAGRSAPAPHWLAFAITSALGILDETVQAAIPNRVFDPVDIAFNTGAAGLAVAIPVAARRLADAAQRRRRGGVGASPDEAR